MAASLPMADATFASTCSGIMMEMIFLSLDDKNGLINVQPEASKTVTMHFFNYTSSLSCLCFIFYNLLMINMLSIPRILAKT
jgi:hypothetical protein